MKFLKGFLIFTLLALASCAPQEDAADSAVTEAATASQGHASNYDTRIAKEDIEGSVICSENGTLSCSPVFKEKVKPCMDPDIWGTEEGKKNPKCTFFCQGHGVGILDENGIPSEELYAAYVDLAFPEMNRVAAKEHVNECLKTLGDKVDPKDPTCEGADEFNTCIFKVFSLPC